jgi:hypothetical protein
MTNTLTKEQRATFLELAPGTLADIAHANACKRDELTPTPSRGTRISPECCRQFHEKLAMFCDEQVDRAESVTTRSQPGATAGAAPEPAMSKKNDASIAKRQKIIDATIAELQADHFGLYGIVNAVLQPPFSRPGRGIGPARKPQTSSLE